MKHRLLYIFILVLTTAYAVSSQPPAVASGPLSPPLSDKPTPQERDIERRDRDRNGIVVGKPKVYDDALLQKMLEETENRLGQLRLIDSGKILDRLGSVTGAEQSISSFALNVQGASLPGADTKAAATAPAPTTTMPSSFNVSASDILNEQVQLSFEVANLRLLIGGSLSDYFVKEGKFSPAATKLKTTLGFPITIIPDKRFKEAVAIVEVEVKTLGDVGTHEPPAITALLPREKTYNVASITDKSTSIQGGVVTQVIGVGGSWLRGRKTHYLVQDQDTLALSFQPSESDKVGFMWQFRPVLGRDYVKSGLKQTFVQLAFPSPPGATEGEIGRVHIRTYWRKYDRRKGVIKEIIPNSLKESSADFDIPSYDLIPAYLFNKTGLEDIGGGKILVWVKGRFLPGTFVRIGDTRPELKFDYSGIRFIASAAELATKKVAIVSHDGNEADLYIAHTISDPNNSKKTIPGPAPIIDEHYVTTIDDKTSLVTVKLRDSAHIIEDQPPLVMVIGGHVFGYSDAPLQRDVDDQTLSAVVPTALLVASPEIIVKPLFAPPRFDCGNLPRPCFYEARVKIKGFDFTSRNEELTLLEQKDKEVMFLLRGSRLGDLHVVVPSGVRPDYIGRPEDRDTMRTVTLTATHLAAHKYLVLQRGRERPFMIDIPPLEKKPLKPIQATERVVVNADEVVIEGDGLSNLVSVKYKNRSIPFVVARSGASATLTGLRLLGVTEVAMTRTLDLQFKEGRATVKLDIVNSKVEQVNK